MPSSWLKVRHFRQELEYSCIPACVRMVLAHYGAIRTEADLRLLLDTKPTGRQPNPTIDTLWRYTRAIGRSLVLTHTDTQVRERGNGKATLSGRR